jgi:DNA-binding transcriptional LysR family regulator
MIVNLRQLEQFLAVAETGSFSRGAERVHSSQPALSTAISKLEEALGVRLFSRRKKQVVLTAEGRRLVASARTILAECDAIQLAFRKVADREDLRVGVCETLDLSRMAASLEQYRCLNGRVRLQVFEGSSPALSERLLAGDLEVAFLVAIAPESFPDELEARLLKRERYMLAVPSNHTLAGVQSASVGVLDGAPFIARTHCEYRAFLSEMLTDRQIRPEVTYRTAQDNRALELVRAGLGVGIFPESLIPDGVVALELRDHPLERQIYVGRKRGKPSCTVLGFLDFVAKSSLF